MPVIFRPDCTRSPRATTAKYAVDPVPRPTISPSCTSFAAARPASSFSRSFAMASCLSVKLDPNQVSREHQAEGGQQERGSVNREIRRLEGAVLDLLSRLVVAHVSGKNRQHASDDGRHAEPSRQTRARRSLPLELQDFLEGDGKAADGESEHDGR